MFAQLGELPDELTIWRGETDQGGRARLATAGITWSPQDCLHSDAATQSRMRRNYDLVFSTFHDCAFVDNRQVFDLPLGAMTSAGSKLVDWRVGQAALRDSARSDRGPALKDRDVPIHRRKFDLAFMGGVTRNREGELPTRRSQSSANTDGTPTPVVPPLQGAYRCSRLQVASAVRARRTA